MKKEKQDKDHSGEIGLASGAGGAVAAGATVAGLAGGGSAAGITYALGAIGAAVGGGMVAGLATVIAAPVAIGAAGFGIAKAVRKNKNKKKH